MTTRMTVALAVLTLGLAIAALAGIPALIENRTVGDIVVIIGFSVAVVGGLLVALATHGQRAQNKAIKGSADFEVQQLRAERRRLTSLLNSANGRLSSASMVMRSATLAITGDQDLHQLRRDVADLTADLEKNAIEIRRRGAEVNPNHR